MTHSERKRPGPGTAPPPAPPPPDSVIAIDRGHNNPVSPAFTDAEVEAVRAWVEDGG